MNTHNMAASQGSGYGGPQLLTGEEAQKVLGEILESERRSRSLTFPAHTGAQGYFRDGAKYVAFDTEAPRQTGGWLPPGGIKHRNLLLKRKLSRIFAADYDENLAKKKQMVDGELKIKELGPRFKLVREHFGITQKELAEALDINQAILSKFENGGMIYTRVLLDLMDYFRDRVDMNYLLQPEGFFSLDDKRAFLVTDKQTNEYMNEVGETDLGQIREIIGKAHQEVEDVIYRTYNKCMTEGDLDAK